LIELKAFPLVLFFFLFTAFALALENKSSPSPAPSEEIPPQALPSTDVTSTTGFAIINNETAPLGLGILILLAFGVFLDKFVKNPK